LARKVVFEKAGFEKETYVESLNQTAGEALLQPTRIYVRAVRAILSHYRVKHVVHGIAHITGGGLFENLERILPLEKHAQITRESWPIPPVFNWIQELGEIDEEEMERVFNMGLGLVLVVSPFYAESIRQQLKDHKIESWLIGEIVDQPRGVSWKTA
ncbi:MAG: phosphoribosylformylglycinamidine cyclo-ligase, partial [Planctomycetaceae bacterium]|nr:phosphoribosylformylglycinamidine cyclo-ligase [Planctomycetaceae bacterium]